MSSTVTEGFLCPICMRDLGNISQLQSHFDEIHEYEDKDILQSVKGIFGKAKKVLKLELSNPETNDNYKVDKEKSVYKGSNLNEHLPFESLMQPLGNFKTHTNTFKKMRSERYDIYVKETNKLILRLDSLLNMDNPEDINQRKEYERTVVEWIPDNLVNNCPYCTKVFNVTHRRRHHCRLCGSVLCHKCSQFLSFSAARTLTQPKQADLGFIGVGTEEPSSSLGATASPSGAPFKLQRSESVSSLVSYVSPATGQGHIRVCQDCSRALHWRSAMLDFGHGGNRKPVVRTFAALYSEMYRNVVEIGKLIPAYCAKVESLNSYGKSFYQLDQASTLRVRILKCGERVENLSRAISTETPNATTEESGNVNPGLRKAVRSFACRFLKDNFLTLPRLPDRETVKQLILESPQLAPPLNPKPQIDQRPFESSGGSNPARTARKESNPFPVSISPVETGQNDDEKQLATDEGRPRPNLLHSHDVPHEVALSTWATPISAQTLKARAMGHGWRLPSPPHNPFDERDNETADVSGRGHAELVNRDSPIERSEHQSSNKSLLVPNGKSHGKEGGNGAASLLKEEDLMAAQALAEQIENVRAYLAHAQLGSDNLEEVYVLETNLRQLQEQLIVQKGQIAKKLAIEPGEVIL